MAVQVDLKSNAAMLISIGEAAERLGLATSALRYYDECGLVRPASRRRGRRMYGPAELRRLAFIQIAHRLGLGLDVVRSVLDHPSVRWRRIVNDQIAQLEALITQARFAQEFLRHALECPSEHPTRECPVMTGVLDRRVAGATLDEIVREHREKLELGAPATKGRS